MTMTTVLISEVTLILGAVVGWIASERFHEYKNYTRHHFEDLFEENPHPELFDNNGKLNRGEYMTLNFDPGYDPDEFDPEDIIEGP